MTIISRLAPLCVVLVLTACTVTDSPTTDPSTPPALTSTSATESTKAMTPIHNASWAYQIESGNAMWTVSKDGWSITAYEMGTGTAENPSYVADDATNKPLVAAGDAIVFVNYVATNMSDKALFVAGDEPKIWAMPTDTPYTQGLGDIVAFSKAQGRKFGVQEHSVDTEDGNKTTYPYEVAPGESFAIGRALPLKYGKKYVFAPSLWTYPSKDTAIGSKVEFERQDFTFSE